MNKPNEQNPTEKGPAPPKDMGFIAPRCPYCLRDLNVFNITQIVIPIPGQPGMVFLVVTCPFIGTALRDAPAEKLRPDDNRLDCGRLLAAQLIGQSAPTIALGTPS